MAFSEKEDVLVLELQAFAAGISNNPSLYGVAIPDAATVLGAVNQFIADRIVANNPATRNVGTIDAKEASKASALGICRDVYADIQRNNGVSNEDKLLIYVTPLNNTRTDRNCPVTAPALSITASTPGAMTAEYRDSLDMTKRAKPPAATMCQLFVIVDEENVMSFDESKARFVGNFTTNPMAVPFNPADRGKQATLFARWGGKRNQFGNWSVPVSMTIAA